MSLDVYLRGPEVVVPCRCECCDHEHTRVSRATLYRANITHNLNRMAESAGIYRALWRPEEMDPPATTAADITPTLRDGLAFLRANREECEALNPPNGWGSYAGLVSFVEGYLAACEANPTATIEVSR